ncbi:thioredoxin [Halobacteriales archaeon Cl-PHB]
MTDEELEEIREQKLEQLKDADDEEMADEAGDTVPTDPVHVDGADHLEEVVNSHDVVLADFYADWCGPCKMLEPTVKTLAAESPAAIAKVDVDANQHLAAQYQVQGVPTLILFADGQPVEQVTGVRDKQTLAGMIDQYA